MKPPKQLHREDIKAALRKQYGSMSAFEEQRGLPTGSAKDVLRGRAVRQTAVAIADVLKMPVHEVFPGRYRDQSTKVDSTSHSDGTHRLNERAA
ncbi:MAG: sugar fermentation stimulation protein [Caulobacter sp.]|nr:sugar fermentation stimulation protein [Caulobacter sp.]